MSALKSTRKFSSWIAPVLGLSLGACGLMVMDPAITQVEPLNKVVRPIEFKHDMDAQAAKEAAEQVNSTYYFLVGHRLSSQGKTGEALVAFDRVKRIDDSSAHLHYVLAQEYMKKGLLEEGVASARKALEIDPKNRDAKLMLANMYATAKKYSEAIPLFTELAKENPDDEEIMLYLALLEMEQKQNDRAYKRLTSFLAENPESPLALFYLGRLEQEKGQKKEALASYRKAIEIRPGFVQAGTYLGFLQEELGDRAGAADTYTWLANQTDDATFHKKLGHLLLDNNDYPDALKAFENYERVDPADLNNRVKVGLLHVELKNFKVAIEKFQSVLKESPDSENVRFYLAAVFEQADRSEDALVQYEKISAASKLYTEALRRRVSILGKAKKVDEGWKILQAAMSTPDKENPIKEELFEIGASFLDNFDRKGEAEKFLSEGLAQFPGSERLTYLRGTQLERDPARLDEAIATMKSILKKNPNHSGALNFVGYVWADRGQHLEEAEIYVRRALKGRPKDPFIMDSLGWVFYKRARYLDAHKVLMEAFAIRPDESVISDHLGDVLVKLSRFEDAQGFYELALKMGPSKEIDRKNLEQKLVRVRDLINASCTASRNDPRCNRSVLDKRTPATENSSSTR